MINDSLKKDAFTPLVARWAGLFDLGSAQRHRSEVLANELRVHRNDILTAKLPKTVKFYRAVEAKAFPVLPNCISDLNSILDIFSALSTFSNLARADFAPQKKPIFWLRLAGEAGEARSVVPALPIDMAADLCDIDVGLLRASMTPLIGDGALEFVRSPEGVSALILKSGFINDGKFRRHWRV